jgi:predicted MFS family arabinose efflux permease
MTRADASRAVSDFSRLWAAQGVSAFGARITREGLPLTAVLLLGASPTQIGILAAMSRGPALVVGLMAGGFVDRSRRRGLLIGMDVIRAVLLASVPIAAWLHLLSMPHLFLATATIGAASVLFEIADHAYLPALVSAPELTKANARLSATDSVAEVGGPALAGMMFQWLGGPYAMMINAATYLVSAAFLGSIVRREPPPVAGERARVGRDVVDGWRAALAEPRVAPLLLMEGSNALFGSFFAALYLIFALKVVGLTTSLLGLTIACGGVGALGGAFIARRLARAIGVGPAIGTAAIGAALSMILIPLAPANRTLGMGFLCAAQVTGDALWVTAAILATSLRQTLLPRAVLGRVSATFQSVAGAMGVTGAVIGGVLGNWLGPRPTLLVAVVGILAGTIITAFSRLRDYREIN